MKILLGLTGSVASTLAAKTFEALSVIGNVEIVCSKNALAFCGDLPTGIKVYNDDAEWQWPRTAYRPVFGSTYDVNPIGKAPYTYVSHNYAKNDPILHIDLMRSASALVIAPLSVNKLAEMANGQCPDLLTSIAIAWDTNRPIVVAPAMHTNMWQHPATNNNLKTLLSWGVIVVPPTSKQLACGAVGVGGMANIADIVDATKQALRWRFPIYDIVWRRSDCSGIPVGQHPGAFGFRRKHSYHTGVDLYCADKESVFAVESGTVVGIEHFTGPQDGSSWWNNTDAVLIEGSSGVICYGEISPAITLSKGSQVLRGSYVGRVRRVLKEGKERPDIPGHSTSMLHLELYPHGVTTCSKSWQLEHGDTPPSDLLDPTPLLIDAEHAPSKRLSMS